MNELDSLVKAHCGRIPVKFRQFTGGLTRTSQLVNMYNQSGTYKSFKEYLQEDIIQANIRLGVKYTPPRDTGGIPIHVENSTRPSVLTQTSDMPIAIPVAQRITLTQEVGTEPEESLSELVANEMMRELYPKEPRGEASPSEREEELRRRVEFLEGVERPILIGREQEAMEETERVEGELEDLLVKRDIENAFSQGMMKTFYRNWYDENFESLAEARQENILSNNEFKTLPKSEKVNYLSDILGGADMVKELLEQQMTEFVEEAE
jgi:hypothetical protein